MRAPMMNTDYEQPSYSMNPAAASNYSMPRPAGPVIGPPKRRKPRGFFSLFSARGKNSVGPAGGGFGDMQPRVVM